MAKAIMVQGTMSSAGKSLLCTGLCRIFLQDGYRVAPFKSQNMALNSFITTEGLEMGRAQAVQAQACNLSPEVKMNPILLKPITNIGSQVIVNGEVLGNMNVPEYFAMKPTLIPDIMRAYNSLAAEYDIIVIEGAGSPAEINLRENDIVNMGMAKLAKAPVLLVGDIDRGGVFAQLYGTIALLSIEEQSLIKAVIINKFRGDINLLSPGLVMLKDLIDKPVAGVIPYLSADIEEEDSLAEYSRFNTNDSLLDIAVIHLPHMSNFTDFAVLEATPDLSVRYVKKYSNLDSPDLIILPGTKNTISDLQWLRENGLETAIRKLARGGTIIFGICGGYQMLGNYIFDPEGVEEGGEITGMGLLPVQTVFSFTKHRTRTTARVISDQGPLQSLKGIELEGYEIHMGQTILSSNANAFLLLENDETDGCALGNVYGTYLHGFFDTAPCRQAIFSALAARKGISFIAEAFDLKAYREKQYDLLADSIRQSLDMNMIYHILEEGI